MAHPIRWGFVALCFLAALVCPRPVDKGEKFWLCAALGITAAADFFILNTAMEAAGVGVFFWAHFCHSRRNRRDLPRGAKKDRFGEMLSMFYCMGIFAWSVSKDTPLLLVLSGCYAFALLTAAASAIERFRRQPNINTQLTAVGMGLFVLCDVFVLLFNTIWPTRMAEVLIWTFYAPSQAALAASIWPIKRKEGQRGV